MSRTLKPAPAHALPDRLLDYLTSLGFEHFGASVATSRDGRSTEADIVAYLDPEHQHPLLVVEVKRLLPSDLSFLDPPAQQAFRNAIALGPSARYLLVTDGIRHFWFDRGISGQSIVPLSSPPRHKDVARSRPKERHSLLALNVAELYQLMGRVADILRKSQLTFGLRMAIEMNKLLIAKLRDEECVSVLHLPSRFSAYNKRGSSVAADLRALFDEAVTALGGANISFSEWASPPDVIYEAVGVLEGYSLNTLAEEDLGLLFWHLFPRLLRVDDSIHTTPVAVADLMVRLAAPYNGKSVLDPTCGSGLLLLKAFGSARDNKTRDSDFAAIVGVERNAEVCELAATNLILNGLPPNCLQNADFFSIRPESAAADRLFDCVLLDPPTGWMDSRDLGDYRPTVASNRLRRELIIVEQVAELLRSEGKLAVVVPDVCLSSPSLEPTRKRLLQSFLPRAIVSLPSDAFADAGHSGKASILLLEKLPRSPQHKKILIVETFSLGAGNNGELQGDSNLITLQNIINSFLVGEDIPRILQSSALRVWTIPVDAIDARNWSVGYLDPAGNDVLHSLNRAHYRPVELGNLADVLSGQNFKTYVERDKSGGKVVQAGAVRDLELILDDCPFISKVDYEKGTRSQIHKGDVLVTTTGQYLGRAAVADSGLRWNLVASGAVTILRPNSMVDPFFLAAFICSPPGKEQIARLQAATTAQPYIRRSDLHKLLVPLPSIDVQHRIGTQIRQLREESRALATRAAQLESASMQLIVKELLEP